MSLEWAAGGSSRLPADYLNATLLASGLSVLVLVGLFVYLNGYTRRRYFTIWTAAWLFYGLWLSLYFSWAYAPESPLWALLNQFCVGTAAAFLLWGSATFLKLEARQRLLGVFMSFLLVWSYVTSYHLELPFLSRVPIFALLGGASAVNAACFFYVRRRDHFIGAGLLGVGFLLWGVHLFLFPAWEKSTVLLCASFLSSAVIQLFIAIGMIVLVLEEVRQVNEHARQQIQRQKSDTDRLRARVQSTEERYRSLFDQASEGIVITTAEDLRILEINQTAERLLGINSSDTAQALLSSFCRPPAPDDPGTRTGADWLKAYCGQLRVVRRDGSSTVAEVDGAPIQFDGSPAFQFFFRELTERVRLEQQLRQAEKLSALGRMISGVAHELNNPLAVIKGYLELILARHNLPETTRADLAKVAHESNRAAKLVSNFLSFAREQPLYRKPTDFNLLVRRLVECRERELRAAGVEWELALAESLPVTAADPDQIEQLLINLINNALQAMAGSPRQRILKIATAHADNQIRILIEDSGPGIPEAVVSHIFEPFFTTKEVGSGTGLGLSIAHSIMSDHQGRVFYQPSNLGGAGFVLEFPVIEPLATDPALESPGRPAPRGDRESPVAARILVLDDEQSLGELLGQLLTIHGHQPTLCQSAKDALALIERQEFDLVLSDFRMPLMDGRQFYYAVKERRPALAERIIFLTGDVVSEDTRTFLKSTGRPHLAKPFNMENIEGLVNQLLRERGGSSGA